MTEDTPISFFRGQTLDGFDFVLSVEGGDTPDDPGVGAGIILTPKGGLQVKGLTARQAIQLKNELSTYEAKDAFKAFCIAKST